MSYARFGPDSDVYVYHSNAIGQWVIHVSDRQSYLPDTSGDLLDAPGKCADRLEELARIGLTVPASAIERLRREQREEIDP